MTDLAQLNLMKLFADNYERHKELKDPLHRAVALMVLDDVKTMINAQIKEAESK